MAILERGSDLRTFFNTKILEISSPETDHLLLENLSSCTFIQHPLQYFEYNSKPQSQKIPSESIPQSQKFSSKRIPQSQNFQAKNYPKLAHIPISPIVKYPPGIKYTSNTVKSLLNPLEACLISDTPERA